MTSVRLSLLFSAALTFASASQALPSVETTPQNSTRIFPYGEGMTDADRKASKNAKPALEHASWSHETCVISYEMNARYIEALKQAEQQRGEIQKQITIVTERGLKDELARLTFALQQIDQHVEQITQQTKGYRANVTDGCKGLYYRLGIESVCSELNISFQDNPFCAAARGRALPGVELTDDLDALRRRIAWQSLGRLADHFIDYQPRPWAFSPSEQLKLSRLAVSCAQDRPIAIAHSAIKCARNVSTQWLDKMANLDFSITAQVAPFSRGKPSKEKIGTWFMIVELMRGRQSMSTQDAVQHAQTLSAAAGLPWKVGPFAQYPRLQFQVYLYDVLFTTDQVDFFASDASGARTWLGTGQFTAHDGRSPKYLSSYRSYSAHALLTPDVEGWKAMLSPATTTLYARTTVMREDGVEQEMEFPITTSGLKQALGQLAAAQQTLNQAMAAVEAERQQVVAYVEKRLEAHAIQAAQWKSSQVNELNMELSQTIAAHPVRSSCSAPTPPPINASERVIAQAMEEQREFRQCQTIWIRDYDQASAAFQSLQQRYRQLSALAPAQLTEAQERWDRQYKALRATERTFAQEVDERNQRQQAANTRSAQSQPARQVQRSGRPTNARQSGRRDHAAEFFDKQRNPDPPYFRDVTTPRRPNGYLSQGWY